MLTSSFLTELHWRGFIHQATDLTALDAACTAPITAYIGFDCTADSLHAGSLLPIMLLRKLQQHGHNVIVLLGGGTTKIGDPSGKDAARQLLDDAQIAANKAGIAAVFSRYLDMQKTILVDNADWLEGLAYIPFLREVGRHFSINQMLTFDSVKLRLERQQPLSFLEFNYMILQAYDFMELNRRHNCTLQLGGSDQWGNIVNGVDLTRRLNQTQVFGLTSPLLTTASGAKMGKTADGALWLDAAKTSPYDFWQYWRNTDDRDVGKFLRLFTELPEQEIIKLEALEDAAINDAKKVLATHITTLCHGQQAADAAASTAAQTFAGGAGENLPHISIAAATDILTVLVLAGLAQSKSEARRLLKGGGVRLDNQPITDETLRITPTPTPQKVSVGKKQHVLIMLLKSDE